MSDQPEVWGNGCECWVVPEHMWTTHYDAVEPGSQVEFNPGCPTHGEKIEDCPDDLMARLRESFGLPAGKDKTNE